MGYYTYEEMQKNHYDHETVDDRGGTRFRGSTEPPLAFSYFEKDDVLLEIAPFVGTFTNLMLREGYTNYHVIDIMDNLKMDDGIGKPNSVSILDLSRDEYPYSDGYFNGVTAWGIAEHLENPYHMMHECYRILKNNGLLILALPNVQHLSNKISFMRTGNFRRWNKVNNHITLLPEDVLYKTFGRYFKLIETKYYRVSIPFRFIRKFSKFFPENKWTGSYVSYIYKKRASPLLEVGE